jgi:PAS domain S-box-containing protein
MILWKKSIVFIEKNGLVLIAIAIILFHWPVDIISGGRTVSRLLITISLLVYGIFTQFLINAMVKAKGLLRDSEEQYRFLIEKSPVAMFVDIKGKIVFINPSFLTLFKMSSRDEIIGKYLENFFPPEFFDRIREGGRIMADEKTSLPPLEVNIKRMDGVGITVVSTPMLITFEGQPAILWTLSNITEHKQNEIELQKAYKLLEIQKREIGDLKAK